MKKLALAGGLVAVAALAATVYGHHQARLTHDELVRTLEEDMNARVVEERLGWAFGGGVSHLRLERKGVDAIAFRMRNDLHYGPEPLFDWLRSGASGAPTLASVDTTLQIEGTGDDELARVLGSIPPLEMQSRVGRSGVGETELRMAPGVFEGQTEKGEAYRVDWKGLAGSFVFTSDRSAFAGGVSSPGVEAQVGDVRITVGPAEWSSDYTDDATGVPAGTTLFELRGVEVDSPQMPGARATLGSWKATHETSVTDGQVDFKLIHRIDAVDVAGATWGPFALDLRVQDLKAESLEQLNAGASELQMAGDDEAAQAALGEQMLAALPALLMAEPQIELRELSLGTPMGPMHLNATLTVDASQPELLANPIMALMAIRAEGQARAPAPIFTGMVANYAKRQMDDELSDPREVERAVETLLSGLRRQGYVVLAGDSYTTRFAWRAGQLSVNGLPVQGSPFGGGDGPPGASPMPLPSEGMPPAPETFQLPASPAD